MGIEVLHRNLTKEDPKLLMDYIQSAASGDAPFFPTTLSLVYDKLIGKEFPQVGTGSDPDSEEDPFPCGQEEDWGYGQNLDWASDPIPDSDWASGQGLDWGASSQGEDWGATGQDLSDRNGISGAGAQGRTWADVLTSRASAPAFTWTPTVPDQKLVRCVRHLRHTARLVELYNGLHCPSCTDDGRNGLGVRGRPYMTCLGCNFLRTTRVDECVRCGVIFL
jgi:hypothetical protein